MKNERTKQSLIKYFQRQDIKPQKAFRKNEKPEKEVEKQVLAWCKNNNLFLSVVESKAVFSQGANRFLKGQAQAGFPDLVGLNSEGLFVAVELKAKGRRSSVRVNQYNFLKRVIQNKGFAAVVDSAEYLETLYNKFLSDSCPVVRVCFLTSCLPVPKELRSTDDSELFP